MKNQPDNARVRHALIVALTIIASVVLIIDVAIADTAPPATSGTPLEAGSDEVTRSFQRELTREPVPTRRITRRAIDDDVLYQTINTATWTDGEEQEPAPSGVRLTWGFGIGMLHAGYGVNAGLRTDRSLSYVSIGCEDYSSIAGCEGTQTIGHFRTGLFGMSGNRSAIGLYGGKLGKASTDSVLGVGIGYVFFARGIDRGGFTLGLGYEVGLNDGGSDHRDVTVQLGVQF